MDLSVGLVVLNNFGVASPSRYGTWQLQSENVGFQSALGGAELPPLRKMESLLHLCIVDSFLSKYHFTDCLGQSFLAGVVFLLRKQLLINFYSKCVTILDYECNDKVDKRMLA